MGLWLKACSRQVTLPSELNHFGECSMRESSDGLVMVVAAESTDTRIGLRCCGGLRADGGGSQCAAVAVSSSACSGVCACPSSKLIEGLGGPWLLSGQARRCPESNAVPVYNLLFFVAWSWLCLSGTNSCIQCRQCSSRLSFLRWVRGRTALWKLSRALPLPGMTFLSRIEQLPAGRGRSGGRHRREPERPPSK